jgi:hypothetical protein
MARVAELDAEYAAEAHALAAAITEEEARLQSGIDDRALLASDRQRTRGRTARQARASR